MTASTGVGNLFVGPATATPQGELLLIIYDADLRQVQQFREQ